MNTDMCASRSSFAANRAALRSAQKPSAGTAAYSRYINRPLGRLIAASAHSFGVSPNQATFISATLSATAIALVAVVEPSWRLAVAVPLLLAFGYVVDSVDGQLARLRQRPTKSGEWLDHTVDCTKTVCLHLAVLISWFRFPPFESDAFLLIPIGFQIVDVLGFFGLIMMPLLRGGATRSVAGVGKEHPLRTWLLLPMDYGFVLWVFVLLAWPSWFVIGYTFLFGANAVFLVAALGRWWRELRRLDGVE